MGECKMKRLFEKWRKDSAGFSLVELVVTIAIMTIVGTSIGAVMTVSTNSYKRGTAEASLQQNAQYIANSIQDLIIDASEIEQPDPNTLNFTGADGKDYTIVFDPGTGEIYYSETGAAPELLAENVSGFTADISGFEDHRTVILNISLRDDQNDREIQSNLTVSSRNGGEETPTITSEKQAQIVIKHNDLTGTYNITGGKIVLEPGQSFEFDASLSFALGLATPQINCNAPAGYTVAYNPSTGHGTIAIANTDGKDNASEFVLTFTTADTKDDGTPVASESLQVCIRRINAIVLKEKSGGNGKKDAIYVYELSSYDVKYGDQFTGNCSDFDYVSPFNVNFEVTGPAVVLTQNGAGGTPSCAIKLTADITSATPVKVYVTAQHGRASVVSGTGLSNKTGTVYDTAQKVTWDTIEIKPKSKGPFDADAKAHGIQRGGQNLMPYSNLIVGDSGKVTLADLAAAFNNTQHLIYRFRDVTAGSGWSNFILCTNGGVDPYVRLPEEIYLFPDRQYEFELGIICYDNAGNVLWPFDNSLDGTVIIDQNKNPVKTLHSGGWYSYYSNGSNPSKWNYTTAGAFVSNGADDYLTVFDVLPGEVSYKVQTVSAWDQWGAAASDYAAVGFGNTMSNPVNIQKGQAYKFVAVDSNYMQLDSTSHRYMFMLEKYDGANWVTVKDWTSGQEKNNGGILYYGFDSFEQSVSTGLNFKFNYSLESGMYRLHFGVDGLQYKDYFTGATQTRFDLSDPASGRMTYYLNIQ